MLWARGEGWENFSASITSQDHQSIYAWNKWWRKINIHRSFQNRFMLWKLLLFSFCVRTIWRWDCLRSFVQDLNVIRIDLELALKLKNDISVTEIVKLIGSRQSNKSWGLDDYLSEIFQIFFKQLAPISSLCSLGIAFLRIPTYYVGGSLSDENPLQCGWCHPISLLNTDVKILAKLLALCLVVSFPSITSRDQTGAHFFYIRRFLNILYNPSSCVTPEILLLLKLSISWSEIISFWRFWFWSKIYILY